MHKKRIYKPSPKMLAAWGGASSARHRMLEGAVRSSKSYTANDIAIREIQSLPPCNVLISGYSISSVARNVMAEWKALLDPFNKRNLFHSSRSDKDDYLVINWRGLRGKKFYIRGGGKEHDFKQIQGGTFGYWYADEMTRHAQSFYTMAHSRLSLPFSRSIGSTNPDSPFHYIKTDYLDKEELFKQDKNGKSLFAKWKFELNDNPSLTDEFIKSIEATYTGIFYKRYVLGLWVLAEGAIYDFYDDEEHVRPRFPTPAYHVVGFDYGTGNPSCFIRFGVNPHTTPKVWAEDEYYFDSKKQGRQKTDKEYADDFIEFLGDYNPRYIVGDPSAASFFAELESRGITGLRKAENDVIDGIRTQAKMLKSGQYAIGQRCTQTRKDYNGYVWDEKAQLKGIDAPIKQNDHTKDVERYVLYTLFGLPDIDYEQF